MVGSSSLMREDQDRGIGLRDHMAATVREVVATYGGFVKEIGDGALWVFPSARRAVLAALELQGKVTEQNPGYTLRVGVHLGEVVVRRKDVFGHAVNLAARVEPKARPGSVYVSTAVRETLAPFADLAWVSMGAADLKNVGTTELFEVTLGGAGAATPQPAEAAFRDLVRERAAALPWLSGEPGREVGVTDEVIVEVLVGEAHGGRELPLGTAVRAHARLQVTGEPGSGKSTLLAGRAVALADEGKVLPVLLHASAAVRLGLFEAIDERYGAFGPVARAARDRKRLVLLVDGVDEVPRRSEGPPLKARLEAWVAEATRVGGNRVVVASRPHGEVRLDGFTAARVRPLRPEARAALLVGLGVDAALANRAIEHLTRGGARLAEVAGNPEHAAERGTSAGRRPGRPPTSRWDRDPGASAAA